MYSLSAGGFHIFRLQEASYLIKSITTGAINNQERWRKWNKQLVRQGQTDICKHNQVESLNALLSVTQSNIGCQWKCKLSHSS